MEDDWFYRTICVDIDGVLADTKNCEEGCDYTGYPARFHQLRRDRCPASEDGTEALRKLKREGYRIVLYTSRISEERKRTEEWLERHGVEYDKLVMDKPIAFIYIDDRGYRFSDWNSVFKDLPPKPEHARKDGETAD